MMADYSDIIQAAAKKYNVDPALIRGVIATESGGDPKIKSGVGATGLMQIMPANNKALDITDATDPQQNIFGGTKLLSQLLDTSPDVVTALRRYHGGDDRSKWGPINAAYPGKVLNAAGVGGQQMPQKSATLPGIPVAQTANGQSDDAIFSAFSGGRAPAANAQGPQSDDAIFAAFSKQLQPTNQPQQQVSTSSQPQLSNDQPGALASFGAGIGRGIQQTVLGGQQLIGHGLLALGNPNNKDNQFSPSGRPLTPIGKSITDTLSGLATRAGNWLVENAESGLTGGAKEVAPYHEAHPIATTTGNIAGSVAATAPIAAIAPVANTYRGAMAVGAGLGAANAALTPVENDRPRNLSSLITGQQPTDYWSEKAKQIGLGALTGGVASPVMMGLGRMISPQVSNDVRTLMDAGVTPTPGQILGGGWARTEAKLSSVPVLGDMIKNAQQRAVQDFNRAAYNEVLQPIGATYQGPAGQQAVGAVRNAIRDAYDESLGRMTFQAADPAFQADITRLAGMAQQLPQAQRQTFMNTLRTQIFGKLGPQGNMDGRTLKGVQEELGDLARGYAGDASFDNRQLGAAIGEIRSAVENSLARTNPADAVQGLANANAAWARFARVRAAAASQGAMNNEGIFTAAQLQNAVRGADKSAGKGATATGNALMQDLSGAGQRVLGSKYPDSGTAGRGLMALLAPSGLAAGFATQPAATAATLGGIGLGSLPYTAAGQRLTAQLLTLRPGFAQPVGNAVSRFGQLAIPGGLPALLSGSQ
ncbi:hypothetical protein CIG66_07000 [Ralstonia pseudosolanacearum]|uniref:lytic transglycosylase domain-containing protein n=1 Tax=Ralstonia pseudosolanacearum TaxID=1310165 RepID=UPI000B9A0F53|nr:hypothetical protein CIG66_07000 [Ralstonia pseudosolanacearum]